MGHNGQTLDLQIGSVCCALRCKDEDVYSRLKRLYRNFFTGQPADITVELEGREQVSPAEINAALSETRYIHRDNCFRTTSNLIDGQYDLANQSIRITGEKSLVDPGLEINHLNRLLALAYYSACKVKYNGNPPAMLVHACAVLRYGRALLFAGPSEAGKTTIARMCGEEDGEVLNDEILLVSRPSLDGGINVQGAPMVSRLSPRSNKSAPLICVLLLKQGKETSVRRVDRVEAYLRFIRQIIIPAYIGQKDRRGVYSLMADFSNEITQNIPVYELEFSLDPARLWKVIGDLENDLRKA
jgi:hypothetical protein